VFEGTNQECVDKIRQDIQAFRADGKKIVVLWTANTEKNFKTIVKSADQLEELIKSNTPLPASVLYGVACALEKVIFLNGSPQNTVSEGMIDLYKREGAFIGGSDFKTGQTKFKTAMLDFFMGSGLRLASCMSYNHLGNNDGKNLNEPETFRSKEISKAGVMDDTIKSNPVLYPKGNDKMDHTIVIKYCPFVGDSKRAMDEYTAQIFLNGQMTLITHATCEDSLLAAPIMLDLILVGEFLTRVNIDQKALGPVLSYLSFFFKAPVTNHPEYAFNAFSRQKETLINFLKICADIPPEDNSLMTIGF
jgi:myo-inositol-1-phosphate synthase